MKDELIQYLNERIDYYKHEQTRLRRESRADEAAHMQIAVNVYNIFLSTYQATKFDLMAALEGFSAIVSVWHDSHRRAIEHNDYDKQFIEEIKINHATEILRRATELEGMHHD